jgi:hypothetical protein
MRSGVAPEVLVRIRLVCLDLPEVTEEIAWTGVRWCVGKKNFAHVLTIAEGWPPAYAKAIYRFSRSGITVHVRDDRFLAIPLPRPRRLELVADARFRRKGENRLDDKARLCIAGHAERISPMQRRTS